MVAQIPAESVGLSQKLSNKREQNNFKAPIKTKEHKTSIKL